MSEPQGVGSNRRYQQPVFWVKRGSSENLSKAVVEPGEPVFCIDTKELKFGSYQRMNETEYAENPQDAVLKILFYLQRHHSSSAFVLSLYKEKVNRDEKRDDYQVQYCMLSKELYIGDHLVTSYATAERSDGDGRTEN